MLARKYIVKLDTGNSESPFVISNAEFEFLAVSGQSLDIDDPSEEEIKAPGLKIRPFDLWCRDVDTKKIEEDFCIHLRSGFKGAALPPNVIDALRGQRSGWKVIRCVPRADSVFFVLVNPEIIREDGETPGSFTDSLEDQLACGCVWAYLSSGYRHDLEITATKPDNMHSRYAIGRGFSSRYTFIEYNGDRIARASEVEEVGEDGFSSITVVEYLP